MKKFEEEIKRPGIGIEQSSIKPSLGKAIEFYTDKVKEYHNAFNEMNKYIDGLEAQIDYYKKDKRFELMAEEIISFKSQLEKQQPEIPEVPQFVAHWLDRKPIYAINGFIPVEIIEWSKKQTGYADLGMNINHLLKLKVNGYTVKEKRFYLKNKLTGLNLVEEKTFSLTGKHVGERFREFEMQYIPTDEQEARLYKNTFTQQEIDSMAAESYEQIPVEEK